MWISLLLLPLGFAVGLTGSLLGVGGGFMLLPILLFLYPGMSPDILTGISMSVVFINSISGTRSYWKLKRIDIRSGLIFALATIPGTITGAYLTAFVSRQSFNTVFGAIMLGISVYLLLSKRKETVNQKEKFKGNFVCSVTDARGMSHTYAYNIGAGLAISFAVGFLSGFLGIGGGVIHVPALICILNFPVHVATATSQLILLCSTFAGILVHLVNGALISSVPKTAMLAAGVLAGSPLGAKISGRLRQEQLIGIFAVIVGVVGVRILFQVF